MLYEEHGIELFTRCNRLDESYAFDPMSSSATNLDLVLDIPVKLTVELGSCQLSMREVLQLAPGSIVPLDKTANAPVSVFVNQRLIARGEVVVVEERLAIKVTEIIGKEA